MGPHLRARNESEDVEQHDDDDDERRHGATRCVDRVLEHGFHEQSSETRTLSIAKRVLFYYVL